MNAPKATVEPLRIEDMVIKSDVGNALYFKRMKYKGCPEISSVTLDFKKGVELIDAGRDGFIREYYQIMLASQNGARRTHFYNLIDYLKWIDDTEQDIPKDGCMAWSLIEAYMKLCQRRNALGKLTKRKFTCSKHAISWLLRKTNRSEEASHLPLIKGLKTEIEHHKAYDLEGELKPLAKALFRSYRVLLKHFNDGTMPDRHPLYDKELVEAESVRLGLKGSKLGAYKSAFKKVLNNTHPNKHIVDVAMLLTYMFTGMNTKPLANMRLSDVKFREVQGGKYVFESVKGRAAYQEQDNVLGFSEHAKRFIASWFKVSKELAQGDESAYLFPFFTSDGRAISYSQSCKEPQNSINKLLVRIGLARVTPSRLRKTKSDTLFRVTESVYLVAMSNNNSVEVTARAYIHGTEKEHQKSLSAAMDAKFAVAKGKGIVEAVEKAKFNHADILDDYEYQRLRKGEDRTHEARTLTGARCNDNRKGAASIINKSLKKAGVTTDKNEEVCTDFLQCFSCDEHAFVTDVDDIWLMLSFKETLQQLLQTPSINSMPERKYADLLQTINSVLDGFKEKNKVNYNQALEVSKEKPHPLYSNVYSLNDLLEIFG